MEADAMRRAAFISGWHARGASPSPTAAACDLQGALQKYTDDVLAQAPVGHVPGPPPFTVTFTLPFGQDPKAEMPYLAVSVPWADRPVPRSGERVRLPDGLFGVVNLVEHSVDGRGATVRLGWMPINDASRATFHALGWSGWPQ